MAESLIRCGISIQTDYHHFVDAMTTLILNEQIHSLGIIEKKSSIMSRSMNTMIRNECCGIEGVRKLYFKL